MMRRNPGGMLAKLPVVGSFFGFLAPAGFGAISVWPTLKVVEMAERYFPSMRADVAFAVSGVAMGALVQAIGGKIPVVSKYKSQLAIAFASAGGAVAAYKYLTGAGGGTVAAEKAKAGFYGAPPMAGNWAGPEGLGDTGYVVHPATAMSYAGMPYGEIEASYQDASPLDVSAMGSLCMTPREQQAALAGPPAWRATFPPPVVRMANVRSALQQNRMSAHAGQEGHRWGWLIKAIGFEQFSRFARMPEHQQEIAVRKMIPQFQITADTVLDTMDGAPQGVAGFYGASVYDTY